MKKSILALLAAIILYAPYAASALTIEEAVGLALENNHKVKRAGHEYSSAHEGIGEARAGLLPTFSASYTYAGSTENAYGTSAEYSVATVTAAYNLFAGFSDLNRMREAKARASAARHSSRSTKADVALAARSAYVQVLRSQSGVKTSQEALSLLERQQKDAELYFREGLIARNDLLKVAVELARVKQSALEAKGGYRIALRSLEKTIGKELKEEQLEPLSISPEAIETDMMKMERELIASRSELKYLRKIKDSYDYASSAAGGAMLPRIDLRMSYSKYGDSSSIGGRTEPYEDETVSMVTASWTLFDGLRSKHTRSRLRYMGRAAAEGIRDTEKNLLLQLKIAVENYAVAREKLVVAETAVSQAEENYRVTELQFKERVSTTTDLLDARTYLTDAKNRYNNARYDLHIAKATIERVLERNVSGETDEG